MVERIISGASGKHLWPKMWRFKGQTKLIFSAHPRHQSPQSGKKILRFLLLGTL